MIRNVSPLHMLYSSCCIGLALLLNGCPKKDLPPPQTICISDGFGNADCVDPEGKEIFKKPSELENYVMRSPDDEAAYTAWCYGVGKDLVIPLVTKRIREIRIGSSYYESDPQEDASR